MLLLLLVHLAAGYGYSSYFYEDPFTYPQLITHQILRSKRYRGPMMGMLSTCDDAKTNLTLDWPNFDYHQFTCTEEKQWSTNPTIAPRFFSLQQVDPGFLPEKDVVWHKCMNEAIEYKDMIPVRGNHRPNWAVYGEYLYLPPQRWLHNLEHGSVVMLYHPCADETQVAILKKVVKSCLYRHVITPYLGVTKERPLVLVTWGTKFEMSQVDPDAARRYIAAHARHAPEDLWKQGKYIKGLISPARVVSTIGDNDLCPTEPKFHPSPYTLDPWAEF